MTLTPDMAILILKAIADTDTDTESLNHDANLIFDAKTEIRLVQVFHLSLQRVDAVMIPRPMPKCGSLYFDQAMTKASSTRPNH